VSRVAVDDHAKSARHSDPRQRYYQAHLALDTEIAQPGCSQPGIVVILGQNSMARELEARTGTPGFDSSAAVDHTAGSTDSMGRASGMAAYQDTVAWRC
jgi:hypothetical protein